MPLSRNLILFAIGLVGFLSPPSLAADRVFWADPGTQTIRSARLDGSDPREVVSDASAVGIAADESAGKIYWTEFGVAAKIRRANFDGSGAQDLVTSGLVTPTDIELDLAGNKMYWADAIAGLIARANLDGTQVETLFVANAIAPTGLALDLDQRQMYWTDPNGNRIQQAPMDGGAPIDVVTELVGPADVEFDPVARKIVWTEPTPSRIARADPDGSNQETLFTANAIAPLGLGLDSSRQFLFWTDPVTLRILGANYDNTEFVEIATDGLVAPRGIALSITTDCLTLEASGLVAGQVATFRVSGGVPGEQVVVVWGSDNGSSIVNQPRWCAHFCFSVPIAQARFRIVTRGRFDSQGVFSRMLPLPPNVSGTAIKLQASRRSVCPNICMSNVIEAVIE